jgi:hypothetical protein
MSANKWEMVSEEEYKDYHNVTDRLSVGDGFLYRSRTTMTTSGTTRITESMAHVPKLMER